MPRICVLSPASHVDSRHQNQRMEKIGEKKQTDVNSPTTPCHQLVVWLMCGWKFVCESQRAEEIFGCLSKLFGFVNKAFFGMQNSRTTERRWDVFQAQACFLTISQERLFIFVPRASPWRHATYAGEFISLAPWHQPAQGPLKSWYVSFRVSNPTQDIEFLISFSRYLLRQQLLERQQDNEKELERFSRLNTWCFNAHFALSAAAWTVSSFSLGAQLRNLAKLNVFLLENFLWVFKQDAGSVGRKRSSQVWSFFFYRPECPNCYPGKGTNMQMSSQNEINIELSYVFCIRKVVETRNETLFVVISASKQPLSTPSQLTLIGGR